MFEEVLFVQAAYGIKTSKQTSNSLSLCQFDAGRLAEGKGLFFCFYNFLKISLLVFAVL